MGLFDRLKGALSTDDRTAEAGVVYECASCGKRFDEPYEHCPECGADDVRERGGFEVAPEDGDSSATRD